MHVGRDCSASSSISEALVEIQSLNIEGKAGDTKIACFYSPRTTYTQTDETCMKGEPSVARRKGVPSKHLGPRTCLGDSRHRWRERERQRAATIPLIWAFCVSHAIPLQTVLKMHFKNVCAHVSVLGPLCWRDSLRPPLSDRGQTKQEAWSSWGVLSRDRPRS